MILQKLCEYYDRIAADPEQSIAAVGFAPQKIGFEVVIESDGSLHALQDIRDTSGRKPANRIIELPYGGKRANAIAPMFLWDKAEYLLGWVPPELKVEPDSESEKDKEKRQKKIDRVGLCFRAAQEFHIGFAEELLMPEYQSLVAFWKNWKPDSLTEEQLQFLADIGTGFGVFRIRKSTNFLHDIPAVQEFWAQSQTVAEDSDTDGFCLVSGSNTTLARLHPVVKGIAGAQSAGASIVSFNDDAFTSYGKEQSFNAPIGESSAFKYATVLNRMLERDSGRRLRIGDTTCVFWADQSTEAEEIEDIFAFGLDNDQFEDETRANEIGAMLSRIAQGEAEPPGAGTGFYVLGLSPNAARLSIRFWISGTAGELIERVAQHQARLEIAKGPKDKTFLPLWLILAQTARESKEIQPLLGGALLRSVLTGGRYPESLLSAIIRRIRAEREIRHPKAAIIKAILNHNHQKEISVMLDIERAEPSYHLGRLFASLERAQEDALPGLNATIKDRYFGAASSTPSSVFPRLIRMSQHHVGKLEAGKKVVAEKRLQEIMGRLDAFPPHLGLADQGLFAIGYYHQRQDFFTKKSKKED
ncbi:type I-C CRISPR-associated protein Cas8c/Csd1 [Mariniblastus fucicola]|uniref:CRISPR-associated protein (Cas_Csd1) n=1 Tax=Mariniblastus fucicola TaxID=980251 RepID=A0A5B9PFY4_9BACT|nr:type I-C CRISPR-associated protein Cas8c/Csd1 [Mariniblastus fucicola]QEG25234.1 CRISPR-associated protein (Cas_Csd1) [Mariniblastus fucicola]